MIKHSEYRPDIDGLRAIAIISVVAYHVGIPGFSGGFVGVDVFFVISGFLITRLLISEFERTETISFFAFYTRRIRRLFPAMLPVILTSLAIWFYFFLGVAHETSQLMILTRYTLFGFANLFLKNNVGGYFERPMEEIPLLHFWSLGVEEQFYFIWPFLILLIGKFAHFKNKKISTVFLPILVAAISGSFIFSYILLSKSLANIAFYSTLARIWELCIGALSVYLSAAVSEIKSPKKRVFDIIASFAGIILIAVPIITYSSTTHFPGLFALPPTIGAALLIISGDVPNFFSRLLSLKPFVRIGLLSYGWYLW